MSEPKSKTLEVGPDGLIRMPYKDGIRDFIKSIGGHVVQTARASQVEPEENLGWVVRAQHDKQLAARIVMGPGGPAILPRREGQIHFFDNREDAIKWELEHFYELIPPKEMK